MTGLNQLNKLSEWLGKKKARGLSYRLDLGVGITVMLGLWEMSVCGLGGSVRVVQEEFWRGMVGV